MGPGITRLRRLARRLPVAGACAVAWLAAVLAYAQEVETARMSTRIDTPVIAVNSADMDFGKVAYSPSAGTIVLSAAAAATCTTTGSLMRTGTCRAAKFEGSVRFLFNLQVTQPTGNGIDLTGPGGARMRLDTFTYGAGPGMLDLGQSGTNHRFWILNLNGSYAFYMGGTLHVGANQAPGVYNGTFQIQLNYN